MATDTPPFVLDRRKTVGTGGAVGTLWRDPARWNAQRLIFLVNSGRALYEVQQILGHSNPSVTQLVDRSAAGGVENRLGAIRGVAAVVQRRGRVFSGHQRVVEGANLGAQQG